MNDLTPNAFDKSKRLLTPNDFKAVFDAPIKKIHSPHFLLFIAKSGQPHARLGLAITKKKLKKAVDRNLVKRHTREFFRLNQHNLPKVDCVLIVKSGAFVGNKKQRVDRELVNATIRSELAEIFAKLSQLSPMPISQKSPIAFSDKSKSQGDNA